MRIAIFTNNHFPRVSGVAVAVDFLETALVRLGHEILTVCPNYGKKAEKIRDDVRVYQVSSLRLPERRAAVPMPVFEGRLIFEEVERFQPDIIHSHHPFLLGEAAADAADRFDVPLVYTFHTLYEYWTHYVGLDVEPVKKLVRDYLAAYTNRCDTVVSPTEPIKEYITEIGCERPIVVIPTGIDLSRFDNVSAVQVAELHRRFRLDRFDRVILSVGRITEEKNNRLTLEATAELVRRGHNVALLIFGKGPDRFELERLAARLGIRDRVIFGGFLDQHEVAAAYELGDVFAFPSPSDTQGIVLYEAQAAGLPIVATRSMASRAAVVDGENGLFADDDPVAFADALERVLADPSRYVRPFDGSAYGYDAIGTCYDELYRDLAARGRQVAETTPLAKLVELIRQALPAAPGR